ncbi:MAG: HesA/MoeB/ThiF family protein [Verrucomicrobiales bacterium]|nr:HesA/MoeB/ThiF family protein [Verrucomicrobiales bacterium]
MIDVPTQADAPCPPPPALDDAERETYGWQIDVEGLGETGQRLLKGATVLVSRVGGLGGAVAQYLAAAGVGRLVLAHAGNVRPSDLNRQILMTHAGIGRSRIESARRRLLELNPNLDVVAVPENISPQNADALVARADVVVDAAPLFTERYALNRAAMVARRPLVECAVYDLEFHLTTVRPGVTACLRCLYPEPSATWQRRFPVLGAVSGAAGTLAALEVIKCITGVAQPLTHALLVGDLRTLAFRKFRTHRNPRCPDCGTLAP